MSENTGFESPFEVVRRDFNAVLGGPERFVWIRHGQVGTTGAWNDAGLDHPGLTGVQVHPEHLSLVDGYLPLETEPEMYIEFAATGLRAWRNREQKQDGQMSEEIGWAVDLTERFGSLRHGSLHAIPPVADSPAGAPSPPSFPSAWDVISDARSVALVLLGHRFATEGSPGLGLQYSAHRSMAINLEADLLESTPAGESGEAHERASRRRELILGVEQGDRSVDDYRLLVADDISKLVNRRLDEEGVESVITGPLHRSALESQRMPRHPLWERTYRLDTLRGAIWAQVADHVLSGAAWRECQNPSCERGIFSVDRPKSARRYCNDRCKEQENNRQKYLKHPERYARKLE